MSEQWRVGKQVPVNVYEGDRPICQCHTALDAKRIVAAVNTVNDYHCGYAAGSADMRERIAEFFEEGGVVEFSEDLLRLAAAIRSLPGHKEK